MKVEILDNELLIRLPYNNKQDYADIINYLNYMDITSKSKANKKEIQELLSSIKKGRWERFKKKREIDA